ncbi:MAG TPA: UvrD-helicase domain-containing protein, partial [Kineosporiaceae bacterium]|nr:UvrD-helicase domain-containing protein [Kineosporiaceae bacterium]
PAGPDKPREVESVREFGGIATVQFTDGTAMEEPSFERARRATKPAGEKAPEPQPGQEVPAEERVTVDPGQVAEDLAGISAAPEDDTTTVAGRTAWLRQNLTILGTQGTMDELDRQRDAVRRVIAESDIPLEDLQGVTITVDKLGPTDNAGDYDKRFDRVRVHPDVIEHHQGLLHELGHRDSARRGLDHSAYDTPERRATEEEYANRYADLHRPAYLQQRMDEAAKTGEETRPDGHSQTRIEGGERGLTADDHFLIAQEERPKPKPKPGMPSEGQDALFPATPRPAPEPAKGPTQAEQDAGITGQGLFAPEAAPEKPVEPAKTEVDTAGAEPLPADDRWASIWTQPDVSLTELQAAREKVARKLVENPDGDAQNLRSRVAYLDQLIVDRQAAEQSPAAADEPITVREAKPQTGYTIPAPPEQAAEQPQEVAAAPAVDLDQALKSGQVGEVSFANEARGLVLGGGTFPVKDLIGKAGFVYRLAPGGRRDRFGKPLKEWRAEGTTEERAAALQRLAAALDEPDPTVPQTEDAPDLPEPTSADLGEQYPPTPEQRAVIDSVLAGKDTVVRALAGTGKTSTLQMIARRLKAMRPRARVIYIAFNTSVRDEAQGKMPSNVEVRTGDSISFSSMSQGIKDKFGRQDKPVTEADKPIRLLDGIAAHLGIRGPLKASDGSEMDAEDQARAIMRAVEVYSISADDTLGVEHFQGVPEDVAEKLLPYAEKAWADLKSPDGRLRITHSHITKMWALSRPDLSKSGSGVRRPANLIMFDEAQDINPVMAKVIADQHIQRVYVGDSNQAIYGFRGATDQLDKVSVEADHPLTKSWRFGEGIAGYGNRFLRLLGAKHRVEGGGPASTIDAPDTMRDPDAILVRSNAGAIQEILAQQESGRLVGVPKGTKSDMRRLVETASWLQGKGPMPKQLHEDLAPYRSWGQVKEAAEKDGDPKLKMLVRIVDQHGVDALGELVNNLIDAGDDKDKRAPDVVVTTAHKSKGLEWDRVKIGPDFAGPKTDPETGKTEMPSPEELRLAYVAVTRAKRELDPGSLAWVEGYTSEQAEPQPAQPAEDRVKLDPEQVSRDLQAAGVTEPAPESAPEVLVNEPPTRFGDYEIRRVGDRKIELVGPDGEVYGSVEHPRKGVFKTFYGPDNRETVNRATTWAEAVERVALMADGHRETVEKGRLRDALNPEEGAAKAWDGAKHVADVGTNTLSDGTVIKLADSYRQENRDFLERNPDRDRFISTQAAGRSAILDAASDAEGVDMSPRDLRVGDEVWAPQESQGATYAWRKIVSIEPGGTFGGTRVTIKGNRKPYSLVPHNDSTMLVRASTAKKIDYTPGVAPEPVTAGAAADTPRTIGEPMAWGTAKT